MLVAWFSSFIAAWNILVEIPIASRSDSESGDLSDNNRVIASFPIVAFVIALFFQLIAWTVSLFLGKSASTIISPIVIAIGIELLNGGKNLISLANFLQTILRRRGLEDAFAAAEDTRISTDSIGVFLTLGLFILRLFCLAVLVNCDFISWIAVALCGSFAVQGIFSTARNLRSGTSFIDGDGKGIALSWLIAFLLCLLAGNPLYETLVSLLISFFIFLVLRSYLERSLGGLTPQLTSTLGTAAELMILILGLTMLART